MPLKPIYGRAPLTPMISLPLRPGQVRAQAAVLNRLYALTDAAKDAPEAWEGVFRLCCLVSSKPEQEPCAQWIAKALATQNEDGSFPGGVAEGLWIARAAYAMYEHQAHRHLLEQLLRWCASLAADWDKVTACDEVRIHPADLLGLLEGLYGVSGKKAILTLCERLRQESMDWSGILTTFSVQRPLSRMTPWAEMDEGMQAEEGSESGFYTRQYLSCHGEALADGARAASLIGVLSGGSRDANACKNGWEKLNRWHGAVCGGLTSDEAIEGTSTASAVDAACLGAWAEAFVEAGKHTDDGWMIAPLTTLLANGLPAALGEEGLVPYQRVNGVDKNCGTKDAYHTTAAEHQSLRALNRLCRGYVSVYQAAVCATEKGADVRFCLEGRYALRLAETPALLTVKASDEKTTVTLQMKQPTHAVIRVMTPAWTEDVTVRVNEESGFEGHQGSWTSLEREWQDGDVIEVLYHCPLRVMEAHHQGAVIRLGAKVMAMPVQGDDWAVALSGEPFLRDGAVIAPVRKVMEWRKRGGVPADLPVLPRVEGDAVEVELAPYAETPCRIAVLPRAGKA